MSRPRAVVPKYCLHMASRQAVCYVNRKPVYLGAYDFPESRREYGELLARLAAEPTRATAEPTRPAPLLTVNILCLKFVTEELPRFSKSERDCQTTLKRVIQQRLQNELANAILGGEFPEGSTIRVEAQSGEFAFRTV